MKPKDHLFYLGVLFIFSFLIMVSCTQYNLSGWTDNGNSVNTSKNASIKGNITLYAPDGSPWECGINNSGEFSCS